MPTLIRSIVHSWTILTLFVVLLATQLTPRAFAQAGTASVSGRVTDPSNAVVPDAVVEIKNVDTNVSQTVKTNEEGLYLFPFLKPGNYLMTVTKQSFRSVSVTGITLNVQDNLSRNFSMQVGSTAESVTVNGDAMAINTVDGSVGTTITRDLVENLPLNGRSFQQLITLTPGVNLIGSAGSTNAYPLGEFSVNGQRATANYFTVDGVSANLGIAPGGAGGGGVPTNGVENAAGGTNAMVSVDALQEFRILTSSFAPEYGRTPGGQVILLTRSGTNQFHGTLYDYFRNTVLDANDWFANQAGKPRSPLQFNDFGGTFGGPIIKNKTFFFFSYEGQRLLQPQFSVTSVPDLASRHAASPATQFILNAFPLPNGPELGGGLAQFAAGYSNPINTNATSIRVDHRFTDILSAFARYSYSPSFSLARQPTYGLAQVLTSPRTTQSFTGGITYAFTPRLINELRLNFSKSSLRQIYTQDSFGGAVPPSSSALFVPPNSLSNAVAALYIIGGGFVGGLEQGSYHGFEQRQINLTDSASWAIGSHQIKFGFDYLRQLPINVGYLEDHYYFSSLSRVVTNSVSDGELISNGPYRSDITEFSLYAQDAWHASPRLTLTYGLRWDFNPPPHSRYANNQDYLPAYLGTSGNLAFGKPGSSYWNTQYSNFAPRVGVAYTLRQAPGWETVARGGFGLFYDLGTEVAAFIDSNAYPASRFTDIPNVPWPLSPEQIALPPLNLTNPLSGSFFVSFSPNLSSPRIWEWNVSIQQALGSAQTFTMSYVGGLGRDLIYGQRYNTIGPQGYYLNLYTNAGTSDYHSLQVQFQRRLTRGLTITAAYSWAHSIDTNSDNISNSSVPTAVINANNNRGPSDFDVRNSFSGALSYSFPSYGKARWLAALSKGWGLDAIISARSALPVDINSYHASPYGSSYYLRPNVLPGVPLYVAAANVPSGKVINSAAFSINPNGQGDLGRNTLRGFDLAEIDLSARRSFHLSERLSLLFRADLFNLLNHPNFANPNNVLGGSLFGQSTAMANASVGGSGAYGNSALSSAFQTGGPRKAQLSLKLQF